MKLSSKLGALFLLLIISQSCSYFSGLKVGNYESRRETSNYFEKTKGDCWHVVNSYVQDRDGTILYSSELEGLLKVEFSKSVKARIEVKRVTKKKSYVKIDVWNNLLPSQELSDEYFSELAQELK